MSANIACIILALVISVCDGCDISGKGGIPAHEKVLRAPIAAKALVTQLYPEHEKTVAEIWLQEVYKGSEKVAACLGSKETYVRDR